MRLSHLRDRASEKGRRKEYPLYLKFIIIIYNIIAITIIKSLLCFSHSLDSHHQLLMLDSIISDLVCCGLCTTGSIVNYSYITI